MVRLVITASGQMIHSQKLDRETYERLMTQEVREELRERIKDFDVISRFWRFTPSDAGRVAELAEKQADGSFKLQLIYNREMEFVLPDEPKMRPQLQVKRGTKPYPLLWDPPLVERRSTGSERGMGLFALHRIKAGVYITEYGGRVLSHEEATELDPCDKTHLLPMYQNGPVFDGRIRGEYTFQWYESQGLLAQFANDKKGTGKSGNVDYKGQSGELAGGEHRTPDGGLVVIPVRKFIVATKEIAAGEELLLLNYGPGHQKFEEECEEKRRREASE